MDSFGFSGGDDDGADPLFMNVVGFTCTDYTSLGKQKPGATVRTKYNNNYYDHYYYKWRSERKELAKMMIQ